jgi:hypothetical protein
VDCLACFWRCAFGFFLEQALNWASGASICPEWVAAVIAVPLVVGGLWREEEDPLQRWCAFDDGLPFLADSTQGYEFFERAVVEEDLLEQLGGSEKACCRSYGLLDVGGFGGVGGRFPAVSDGTLTSVSALPVFTTPRTD